jgi:hypothetical protein
MIQRHGGEVDAKFDISTLAHISDGYSSGTIDQVRKWHCDHGHTARNILYLLSFSYHVLAGLIMLLPVDPLPSTL